jgi:uncharacterized membrane protein
MNIFLAVHLAATLFMTGLIWFVQVVHYPLMARVDTEAFAAYEQQHQRRTGWVVGPAMLIEMLTGIWLLLDPPPAFGFRAAVALFVMLLLIWASTAFVQVPLHRRLEAGPDPAAVSRLVQTNWLRTMLWSARGAVLLALILLKGSS